MNTPQFDWTRSRLPKTPQPVPPIYQPEVAADAVIFAATHQRREIYVGLPTLEAIIGNKIAPGLLDRYLARKGFRAQQTDEPARPDRLDNLMSPAPGNFSARGRFSDRSRSFSPQLWATEHRKSLSALGLLTIAAGMAWRCWKRNRATKLLAV